MPEKSLPIEEIKKQSKILFIDDEDVALISILRKENWIVDHWKDVQSLTRLESGEFDLIFLDIGGVGQQYSPEKEGFGILERIKSQNPSVLVVAYSGLEFDFSKSKFWELADGKLSKTLGAIDAIELMEGLLKEKFSGINLWKDAVTLLQEQEIPDREIKKMESELCRSKNEKTIKALLEKHIKKESKLQNILGIIAKITMILKYLQNG